MAASATFRADFVAESVKLRWSATFLAVFVAGLQYCARKFGGQTIS